MLAEFCTEEVFSFKIELRYSSSFLEQTCPYARLNCNFNLANHLLKKKKILKEFFQIAYKLQIPYDQM